MKLKTFQQCIDEMPSDSPYFINLEGYKEWVQKIQENARQCGFEEGKRYSYQLKKGDKKNK